jgi:hypothetical protein
MAHLVGHQVRVRVQGDQVAGSSPWTRTRTWSSVFSDLAVTAEPDGTTFISGELADQAAVHGLLAAIRDLGLSLISVETIGTPRRSSR